MKKRNITSGGFTLVEALATTAVVAILATAAVQFFIQAPITLAESGLSADVRQLNQAVDLYKTFGGSLEGATTPQEVLRRLKSRADATGREQVAGLTSNLIDRRMQVRLLPEAAARSDKARALWDATEEKFVITTEEHDPEEVAVAAFQVDWSPEDAFVPVNGSEQLENGATEGAVSYAATGEEESRNPNLKLALGNGWIWDYNEAGSSSTSGPTQIPLPGNGGSGGGFGDVVDDDDDESGGGGDPVQQLDPPVFSIPAGSYLITSYNLELTLANPNAGGVSRIIYQVSGSPWNVYGGETITVPPAATVTAFVESVLPAEWSNSDITSQFYAVGNVQLEEPEIETTDDEFGDIEIENN